MDGQSQTEFYKNITKLIVVYKPSSFFYFIQKRTKGENRFDFRTNRVHVL